MNWSSAGVANSGCPVLSGSVDDAMYAASKEWASIAVPEGRTISDGRVSDGTLS